MHPSMLSGRVTTGIYLKEYNFCGQNKAQNRYKRFSGDDESAKETNSNWAFC